MYLFIQVTIRRQYHCTLIHCASEVFIEARAERYAYRSDFFAKYVKIFIALEEPQARGELM